MGVSSASVVNGNTVDLFGPGNVSLGSLAFFTKSGSKASNAGAAAAAAQNADCFAEGARIETVDGPVRSRTCGSGTARRDADGAAEPIVWIGATRGELRAASEAGEGVAGPRPRPARLAETLPVRDLYLSPDHAVFVNGVLVPVKLLINGTSITQVERDRVHLLSCGTARATP